MKCLGSAFGRFFVAIKSAPWLGAWCHDGSEVMDPGARLCREDDRVCREAFFQRVLIELIDVACESSCVIFGGAAARNLNRYDVVAGVLDDFSFSRILVGH